MLANYVECVLKSYCYVLSTASYFVNWTYQNPKSCTVVVGEPTEVFPASKATSLEFANKTMARPHQSLPTIGTGKEEHHSRHRRSVDVVDGHASSLPQSVSSEDSSTAVNMHDITKPSVNTVSLVHGVAEDITTQRDEENTEGSNNAFVSSNNDDMLVNTGDLTTNNRASMSDNPTITSTTIASTNAEQPTTSTVVSTTTADTTTTVSTTASSAATTAEITTKETNYVSSTTSTVPPNTKKETYVEHPLEINDKVKTPIEAEEAPIRDNIAYEPENMQGDSFPLIRSYGLEKLQFFKIQNQLEQIKEVLHIYSNDSSDTDKDLEKLHYDSENSGSKTTTTTSTSKIMTTGPIVPVTETTTTKPKYEASSTTSSTEKTVTNEHVTRNSITNTVNKFTTHMEHVMTTIPTPSVTNDRLTTRTTTEATPDEPPTVNSVDTKFPDVSNPKHVLINLTISADNAESSSYKQLYSLTLTVPTVGDTNEIPTVKITPMDSEPTQASHFNKPVTLEGSTKVNNSTKDDNVFGGSCECSCPACISNATDDFYDELNESETTTTSPKSDSSTITDQISSTDYDDQTDSTTEDISKSSGITESETVTSTDSTTETITEISTTTEINSTTEGIESTTDSTTEAEILTTTESPKCVCPKIQPPPILILEGEVDLQ